MGLCEEMEWPLPCRALCRAMAECLTAAEPHRRMETGPSAFGWSPATHGTMLAARQPPLPLISPILFLEHQEKLRHSTVKAPQEDSDGLGILGWWVLHKMDETQEVWLSNLIWCLLKLLAQCHDLPWWKRQWLQGTQFGCFLSDLLPQWPPPMKAWLLETLNYETRPHHLLTFLLLTNILRPPPTPNPISPTDLWIAWVPSRKDVCLQVFISGERVLGIFIILYYFTSGLVCCFFGYIYKFQQAILKRKVLFTSLPFSIHGTNHGNSFRLCWCQTLCLPLLCTLNEMDLFSYDQTILVSVISGLKYNCISNPICAGLDLFLSVSLGSFPALMRNFFLFSSAALFSLFRLFPAASPSFFSPPPFTLNLLFLLVSWQEGYNAIAAIQWQK